MKRIIAILLALALATCAGALAEATMEELRAIRKNSGDRIAEMEPVPTLAPATPEPEPTPVPHYDALETGMKGDGVKRLQKRLIDLGYLKDGADGVYGKKTAAAVQAFQKDAGLPETGTADDATQLALFSGPDGVEYEALDYDRAVNHARDYKGTRVTFSGTVLQLLEAKESDERGTFTVMRVATQDHHEGIVYVAWFRPEDARRIPEGGEVTVYGVASAKTVYETTAGATVTLPRVEAEEVERR